VVGGAKRLRLSSKWVCVFAEYEEKVKGVSIAIVALETNVLCNYSFFFALLCFCFDARCCDDAMLRCFYVLYDSYLLVTNLKT
jgi:hypothetical protein